VTTGLRPRSPGRRRSPDSRAGFSTQETDALATAVQTFEAAGTAAGLRVVGSGSAGDAPAPPTPPVDHLFAALLYGTERWDGAGYPEGLRGESIPRVARAFAVLRAYVRDSVSGGASLRAESGRRFDPRMVNRFLAFLGEEASRWNPLDGVADGRG